MNQSGDKHFGACDTLAMRFNELTRSARMLFPSDSAIMGLKELEPTGYTMITPMDVPQVERLLQEAKVRTLQLMDILDIEVKEKTPTPYQVIQVSQILNSNQLTNINLDQLIQTIQQQNVETTAMADAQSAVRDFAAEIEKPRPNVSKLKEAVDRVSKIGKPFIIPLLLKLLENWDKIFK
jgi:hypothetical protein